MALRALQPAPLLSTIFLFGLMVLLLSASSILAQSQSEEKQGHLPERIFQFSDSGYSVALTRQLLAGGELLFELRITGLAAFPLRYKSFRNPDRLHVEIEKFRVPRVHQARIPQEGSKENEVGQLRIYNKGNSTHIEVLFGEDAEVISADGARENGDAVVRMLRRKVSGEYTPPMPEKDIEEETLEREDLHQETLEEKAPEAKQALSMEDVSSLDISPQEEDKPRDESTRDEPRDESKPRPILATQLEEYYLKRLETQNVFVENQYGKNLLMEARVGRLLFPGTEHESMEIDLEVQVKPKSKVLSKGKKFAFDLLYLGSPGFQEKVFQLELKAFSGGKKKKNLGVLRVPLFSMPEKPRPDIQWQREESTLGLKNLGNVSVMLRDGKICFDLSRCQRLDPIRIYPGNKVGIQVPKTAWAEFMVAYQQGRTKLQVPVYAGK